MMQKKYIKQCFLFLFISIFTFLDGKENHWYPLFGGQTGIAVITDPGQSQLFPIVNTGVDQFYQYTPNVGNVIPAMYGAFVGVEWRAENAWTFQLNANYNQSSDFLIQGVLKQGLNTSSQDTFDYSYSAKIRSLLAEIKVQYSDIAHINPYFVFGLGGAMNSAFDFTTTASGTMVATRVYENALSFSACYEVGIGVDIFIIEQARIGFGYRFVDFRKLALGAATVNSVPVAGTISQSNLYANEFLMQLSITF